MPKSVANSEVTDILDRHNESRKWMQDNYFGELTEVYRAIKMRTKPIRKRDAAGRFTKEEDKSRTNIAMPGMNIAWRRGVARLTAQPYQLRYTGNCDPAILEALSALAIQQYDRSDEATVDRRVVMQAKAFGFSYSKVRRDVVNRVMQFRRALVKGDQLMYRDRATVRQWQGASPSDIQGEIEDLAEQGVEDPTQLSDQEVAQFLGKAGYETQVPDMTDEGMAQFIAQNGNVIVLPTDVRKYEGPVVKWIFIGDLDLEPGCMSLNDSSYVIESFTETDLWLQKQVETVTYKDENGQEVPAFDPIACQELLTREPDKERKVYSLKEWFLGVTGKQGQDQYQFPKRLRTRKEFDFLEQHTQGEDGRMWITWVCPNYRDKVIGKMPYEDDLYGKSYFSEMVLFDDLLDAYGDSTPRMLRFLHNLDNRTVAQNYDLISNLLRRFVLTPQGVELGDEYVTRGNFRQLTVPDINRIKVLEEPPIPPGALEREAMIQRRMAQIDPNLNTVDTGSASNPLAGKLATTAMLNAKAADSITQFELDGRDRYIRELGYKKLWINQQMAGSIDPWEIGQNFWGEDLQKRVANLPDAASGQPLPEWALSDRYGKTTAIRLDPMEIQEDLTVEPVAQSYLSVDDELRKSAAQELDQIALAAPDLMNRRKVVEFHLSTIRGLPGQPAEYFNPEPTGPQLPAPKTSLNINLPLDKVEQIPSDIVNQLLEAAGFQPSQELQARQTLDAVGRMNEAGQAADELTTPESTVTVQNQQAQEQAMQKAKATSKPNGKAKSLQ